MQPGKSGNIRVVLRAFDVLEAFDTQSAELSLQVISRRIGLPKTTTFRLLATLIDAGYVVQTIGQDYRLSLKVMRLAAVARRGVRVLDVARPILMKLAATTQETLDFSILSGSRRVCLDVVESPYALKSIIRVGEVLPLRHGASGKVLLAQLNPHVAIDILAGEGQTPELAPLLDELAAIRRLGYAMTVGERVAGVTSVAVAIQHDDEAQLYSMTVAGPSFRFDARREEFIRHMTEGAAAIRAGLGGPIAPQRLGTAA